VSCSSLQLSDSNILAVGYHSEDKKIKSEVLSTMQQLGKLDPYAPGPYRNYARARSWNDLVQVLRDTFANSAMDELVLLLHSGSPRPYGWTSGFARPVIYDRLEDVVDGTAFQASRLLDGPTVSHPDRPNTGAMTDDLVNDSHDGDHEDENVRGGGEEGWMVVGKGSSKRRNAGGKFRSSDY